MNRERSSNQSAGESIMQQAGEQAGNSMKRAWRIKMVEEREKKEQVVWVRVLQGGTQSNGCTYSFVIPALLLFILCIAIIIIPVWDGGKI